ncbi:MAG: hypothetical protein HRF49_05535 [bacterium]
MFVELPEAKMARCGTLRDMTHFQAMKAIHECNPPQLYAIIQEWRYECQGPEYLNYLTYYCAWHYLLTRDEDAWGAFIDALTGFENSDEPATFPDCKTRVAIATSMWCAAIRGDFELTVSLSTMAVGKGEPRPTARLALTLADRNRDGCKEQLAAAVNAVKEQDKDELYAAFLEQLFSDESLDLIFKGPAAES